MFDYYIKVYGHRIHRLAARFAGGDPHLLEDLEQEGRIAVWQFDAATVRTNESAIIMRVVRDAMLQYRRREYAAQSIPARRHPCRVRRQSPLISESYRPPMRRNVPRHQDATPRIEQIAA